MWYSIFSLTFLEIPFSSKSCSLVWIKDLRLSSSPSKACKVSTFIVALRSLANFAANFVLLIGITIVFFKGNEYKNCGKLWKPTKVYIILEWVLICVVVLFVLGIVIFSLM